MYAAELAMETGDRDRASSLLQRVLASSVDPVWEFESNRDRATAQSLLEQLSSA
jgi:Tfp pilus assembly protein FimV